MVPPPVSSSLTNTDSGTEGQTSLSHPPRATCKVPEGSFDSLQSPFPTALFLRDLESKEGNGQREHFWAMHLSKHSSFSPRLLYKTLQATGQCCGFKYLKPVLTLAEMTHRDLLFLLKQDWALGALCHHPLHPWIKAVTPKSNTVRQAEPQATAWKTGDFTDLLVLPLPSEGPQSFCYRDCTRGEHSCNIFSDYMPFIFSV